MQAHIILAHPESRSFNGHLAQTSQNVLNATGWQHTFADLYAMDFDAREGPHHYTHRKDTEVFHTQTEQRHNADGGSTPADVDAQAQCLLECDLLVVHFPLWWFGVPAILKGWMDRVFVYGRLYSSTRRYDQGVCTGKKMIACVTAGASAESCSYAGREGDTLLHLWPLHFAFRYLGFDIFEPEIFYGVGGVSFIEGHEDGLSTLDVYSSRWAETLKSLSSRPTIQYNRDQDFDESKRLLDGAPVYSPFIRHDPEVLAR